MADLSNENEINAFFHCSLCVQEWKRTIFSTPTSPAECQSLEVGWTDQGLQVWCREHDCNVVHIDFEGQKHPANVTRKGQS